jgi:ABC-type bacteriocin/lantibiotic exporter with double-glycine peptidase domain
MDEATSALDAETEHSVSQTIQELSGTVTLVIVAHRLATVRACDVVAYVDRGAVSVIGTFEEVRRTQPHFDKQARLLGL